MSESKQIHEVLSSYLHKLESLQDTLPSLMMMAHINRRIANAKRLIFLKENGDLIDESENKKEYALKIEHQQLAERLYKKFDRASTAYKILPSKFLVSFVSEYDAFLGNLLKTLFRIKPEILDCSEKNISFAELK